MMNIPTPCIFAHRGASGAAPENTLSAFKLALDQGAHAIELDAKLSLDGKIVVIHDPTLGRTTNGSGFVHQTSYPDLRNLDAGSWFSSQYAGERIPLLSEVLESVGNKMIINIEITHYRTWWDELPQKLSTLINDMKLKDSVIFSSFYPLSLWKIRRLMPDAQTALLTEPRFYGLVNSIGLSRYISPAVQHPYYADLTAERIARAHQKGIRLHAWTVNKQQDMRRLLQWGIDGIFTDHPALALSMIDSCKSSSGDV